MTAYLTFTCVVHFLSAFVVGKMIGDEIDDIDGGGAPSLQSVLAGVLHAATAVWALWLLLSME